MANNEPSTLREANLQHDALLIGAELFASGVVAMEVFSLRQPGSESTQQRGSG